MVTSIWRKKCRLLKKTVEMDSLHISYIQWFQISLCFSEDLALIILMQFPKDQDFFYLGKNSHPPCAQKVNNWKWYERWQLSQNGRMNKTMECLDLSRILNFGDDVKKTDYSVDHGGQERIRHGNDPHLDLSDLAGRRHDT